MQRHVRRVGRHSRQVGRDRVAPQRQTRRAARDVRHQRVVHRQEGQAHAQCIKREPNSLLESMS